MKRKRSEKSPEPDAEENTRQIYRVMDGKFMPATEEQTAFILSEAFTTAGRNRLRKYGSRVHTEIDGSKFKVHFEDSGNEFVVIVVRNYKPEAQKYGVYKPYKPETPSRRELP